MDKETEILLSEGRLLPLMEEFYSLQGEGYHTGSAAYFTRIGGCDVGCSWCDIKESWDASKYPPVDVDKIVRNAAIAEAKAVVVTGGEPLLYNLDYFCRELKKAGIKTYLETSGSSPLSGEWDWICLSPKKHAPPLPEICSLANELKVIIEEPEDFSWAEENIKYLNPVCLKYLQPEWSERETITPLITEYIKKNPSWKISIQSHKFIGIP